MSGMVALKLRMVAQPSLESSVFGVTESQINDFIQEFADRLPMFL